MCMIMANKRHKTTRGKKKHGEAIRSRDKASSETGATTQQQQEEEEDNRREHRRRGKSISTTMGPILNFIRRKLIKTVPVFNKKIGSSTWYYLR